MIPWLRRLAVPAVAVLVALGVSGCSSTLNDAATITFHDSTGTHTVHITQSQLHDELQQLAKNSKFVQLIKSQYMVHGDGKQTVDSRLAAQWLSILISQAAVDDEFRADKLSVSSADTTEAATSAAQSFPSDQQTNTSSFSGFSKSFQKLLIDRDARAIAVERYYASCPSGRLVYHLAASNHDNAEKAFALIRSGQPFESVAQKSSLDTTSAPLGGAIGCLAPGVFPPAIETVASQVPFDVVTVPVKTSYGYDLILVRKWQPAAAQQFANELKAGAQAAEQSRAKSARVWLNPQYGTWSPATAGQGSQTLPIALPQVPSPRLARDASVATSTTAVPTGG